jgi:hypothetical protein
MKPISRSSSEPAARSCSIVEALADSEEADDGAGAKDELS